MDTTNTTPKFSENELIREEFLANCMNSLKSSIIALAKTKDMSDDKTELFSNFINSPLASVVLIFIISQVLENNLEQTDAIRAMTNTANRIYQQVQQAFFTSPYEG